MTTRWQTFLQALTRRNEQAPPAARAPLAEPPQAVPAVEIAPNDPIIAYFLNAPGVAEVDKLNLTSPALAAMKAAGVRLVVPRVSQQEYSSDDRALLNNLATQAAPALRVAQLVRQQQVDVRARERLEHEM